MSTASSTRIVLLPDDSALLELLARAEQLLEVITVCEQDTADDPEESAPWRLPAPVAEGVATSAIGRVACVVRTHLTPLAALTAEPVGELSHLAHLLAEAGETDLVLTTETEQTYHRVADWMNSTLTGGDPLERWAW